MVKKAIHFCWSIRHQFMKYFVVGISGFVLDLGTLVLFKEVFGMSALFAVILNQPLVLGYNFSLNKWWSFKNKEMPHWQLVRYITLAGFNYGFSAVSMYIFHQHYGADYRLVRIGAVGVMVLWNFFLYKYWVYKESENIHRIKSDSELPVSANPDV